MSGKTYWAVERGKIIKLNIQYIIKVHTHNGTIYKGDDIANFISASTICNQDREVVDAEVMRGKTRQYRKVSAGGQNSTKLSLPMCILAKIIEDKGVFKVISVFREENNYKGALTKYPSYKSIEKLTKNKAVNTRNISLLLEEIDTGLFFKCKSYLVKFDG